MPVCPSCAQEYEAHVERCFDCNVALAAGGAPSRDGDPEVLELEAADDASLERMRHVLTATGVPWRDGQGERRLAVPFELGEAAGRSLLSLPDLERDDSAPEDGPPRFRLAAAPPEAVRAAEALAARLADLGVRELASLPPDQEGALHALVLDGSKELRARATLAVLSRPDGLVTACALLARAAREGKEAACYALASSLRERIADPARLDPLVEVALDEGLPAAPRLLALHALGRLQQPRVGRRIAPLLAADDEILAEAADEALCSLTDDDLGFDPTLPAAERAAFVERWGKRLP